MQSGEQYNYERPPQEWLPPHHPNENFHQEVSFGLNHPPPVIPPIPRNYPLPLIPPTPRNHPPPVIPPNPRYHPPPVIPPNPRNHPPPVIDRPAEGTCGGYEYGYAPVGYREYDDGRSFSHERGGPLQRHDNPDFLFPTEDRPAGHDYSRDDIDGIQRNPHHVRDRSPHKRDPPYYEEPSVSQPVPLLSISFPSVSSRGYSTDGSKDYAFLQAQHGRSFFYNQMTNETPNTIVCEDKEMTPSQFLKSSKDVSHLEMTTTPPSFNTGPSEQTHVEHNEKGGVGEADSSKLCEENQQVTGSDAVTTKTEETEQAGSSEQTHVENNEKGGAGETDNNKLCEENQEVTGSDAVSTNTEENELGEVILIPGQKNPRRRRRQQNGAPLVTWGAIKALNIKAQRNLAAVGQEVTPEKLIVAMLAQITKNSVL